MGRSKLSIKQRINLSLIRRKIEKNAVTVGVHQDAGRDPDTGATVAQIYAYNEFGTETIPERPTMRPTLKKNAIKYRLMTAKIAAAALNERGYNIRQAMGKVGMTVQNDVQNAIRQLDTPPNAQSTIDRKGSSNPLIDTGQMVNSIRWGYKDEEGR